MTVTDPRVAPPANCVNFRLTGGVRYIDYDQIAGTNNVAGGVTVADAFTCMANNNGDLGCPYLQVLEASYRALSNPPPENAGFLRDDSLLVVVFLADGDDCLRRPPIRPYSIARKTTRSSPAR